MVIARLNDKIIRASVNIRKQVLGNLSSQFAMIMCDMAIAGVSCGIHGLFEWTLENVPLLATHPLEWKFYSNYQINIMLRQPDDGLKNTALLYHVDRWCPLLQHDMELTCDAVGFFRHFKNWFNTSDCHSVWAAYEIVKSIFECHDIIVPLAKFENKRLINKLNMALFALILVTENNYQAIYNAHLRHILYKICINHDYDQVELVHELFRRTQSDFMQFPVFFDKVALLPDSLKQDLLGIFQACRRVKEHDAPFLGAPPIQYTPNLFKNTPVVSGCAPPPGSYDDENGKTIMSRGYHFR